MTRNQHLLIILMEECDEISQRASKALRFGHDEIEPGQELTNAERIMAELADLQGVTEMLFESGVLQEHEWTQRAVDRKKEKVERFLEYSKKCGTLDA